MSGWIYLVGASYVKSVKIGFTAKSPWGRLASFQTGSPCELDLLAFWPGTMEEEQRLHRTFEPLNLHGEWFSIDGKLQDFLWYMVGEGYGPERQRPRQLFEDALWDCVVTDQTPWSKPESALPAQWFDFFADQLADSTVAHGGHA